MINKLEMREKNKEKRKNQMVTECVWERENNFSSFGLGRISIIIFSLNLLAVSSLLFFLAFEMLTVHG